MKTNKKTGNTPEEQRQYKREYMRKWNAEHREHLSEYRKKDRLEHPEKYKKYYEDNKERIYESNTKWRKSHAKQFSNLVLDAKRRKVEKLRAQGCTNPWMVINWGHEPKFKSKEALINKIKNDIETKEKSIKYYEENIKRINEEINKHKNELKDLESKGE